MNRLSILAASAALLTGMSGAASALVIHDTTVTPDVIFGSGNANGGFTVDRRNNVEVGLRGKLRHNASGAPENTFNANGDGTFSFAAGVAPTQSAPTAVWSFEWSINSNLSGVGGALNTLTYRLGIDTDAGIGASFLEFDPINGFNAATGGNCWDHATGNNSTGNGGGTSVSNTACGTAAGAAAYTASLGSANVAQNSWKPHWFIAGFDPTVDGQYDFYLAAYDGATELARTDMSIIVGSGAASVPGPATAGLLALGVVGLALRRRRKLA